MKPTPPGWPRISAALFYRDPKRAIDWLCEAFGFEIRIKVESEPGQIEHSELEYGDGLVMIADTRKVEKFPQVRSPGQVGGGNTMNLMMYVDDVEAHCKRAREAGARIVSEPKSVDYGEDYWEDRGYECVDIGGHHWWIYQRLRNPKTA